MIDVRTMGLVAGIELAPLDGQPGARAFKVFLDCWERGVLVRTTGDGGFTPVVLTAYAYGALIVLLVIFEPGGLAAIARRLTHRFTRVTTR